MAHWRITTLTWLAKLSETRACVGSHTRLPEDRPHVRAQDQVPTKAAARLLSRKVMGLACPWKLSEMSSRRSSSYTSGSGPAGRTMSGP